MKNILTFIFSFFLMGNLFLLSSCKSKYLPEIKEITKTIETIQRDTILTTKVDSTFYEAYINCVNGEPVLVEPKFEKQETRDKKQDGKLHLNVKLRDGKLQVDCKKEAEKLFFSWKEQYRKEVIKMLEQQKPQVIVKPLTKFQKVKIWIGNAVIWLIGLVSVAYFIRFIIRKYFLK